MVSGQRWAQAIQEALENCLCVLVILSPSSVASVHVLNEVTFALNEGKRIIPVFHRNCKTPVLLSSLHHVDFRTEYARGLETLLRELGVEQQAAAVILAAVSAEPHPAKPLYMAIADRELEWLQPGLNFDASFLLSFLFEETLAITDAYLLISNRLAKHVLLSRHGGTSLFEKCLNNGIVVVKARDPQWASIDKVLRADYPGLVPEFGALRKRMTAACENARIEPWPSYSVAERFQSLVQQHLCQDEPSTVVLQSLKDPRRIQKLFRETLKLRLDGISEAVRRTRAEGGAGLQRWQYLQILREEVAPDFNVDAKKINSIEDVVRLTHDNEAKRKISQLWSIVCECYRYNQAQAFNTLATCPGYDKEFHLLAADEILTVQRNAPLGGPILETVAVPPLSALLTVDPETLVKIRNDLGFGYRNSVRKWRADPENSTLRANVRDSLKSYASALIRWAESSQEFRSTVLSVILGDDPAAAEQRFLAYAKDLLPGWDGGVMQSFCNRSIDGYLWGQTTKDVKVEINPLELSPRPDLTLPDRE